MKKTTVLKKDDIKRNWYLVDATGVRLGILASFVASLLQGKGKPSVAPNIDCGDYVIVINSKDVDIHPKKVKNKMYWHHTGYPGGIKQATFGEMIKKKPNRVVKKAVWGMIPKTKLGRKIIKKLFVYEDVDHKHEANKPKLVKVS